LEFLQEKKLEQRKNHREVGRRQNPEAMKTKAICLFRGIETGKTNAKVVGLGPKYQQPSRVQGGPRGGRVGRHVKSWGEESDTGDGG